MTYIRPGVVDTPDANRRCPSDSERCYYLCTITSCAKRGIFPYSFYHSTSHYL